MKKTVIFILVLAGLSACEKETYVDYVIDNRSSGVISVSGINIIRSTGIDQTLGPGERKVVSGWSKRGKETDYFEPVSMFGDDLLISNTSGDTLTRDYRDLSNWIYEIDDRRATASHEYVLVVEDSDF